MTERGMENGFVDRGQGTDTSSESSETLESYSERISLLPPDLDTKASNYKTTSLVDAAVPQQGDEGPSAGQSNSKSVFAILSLLFIGVFISNADSSLVFATYGTISSEFGAFADASWLSTSYALAGTALQPLSGKLSDIYGRQAVLLTSYFLFGIGCVICGIGTAFWQVIAGRIISGCGAAGMTILVSVLITDLVPLIQVASWRSYVNVVATLGRAVGGPIGGGFADTIGWRWSFAGQGPLIAIAMTLVALKLPSRTTAIAPSPQIKGQPSKFRRIDFVGAFSIAVTIVLLLGAFSVGGQSLPWSHPFVIAPIVVSILTGAFFVRWETKHALEPVFPPSLVIQRDVATSYGVATLVMSGQIAMMYSIPLYFRATQNSTNTVAGSHLFPAVIGNAVGGLVSGLIIQRTGQYKGLAIFSGLSAATAYILLITTWGSGHVSLFESLYIVPGGLGAGISQAALFMHCTSSVKQSEITMATSGMYLSTSIGMVLSLAVSSAIQMASLNILLERALKHLPDAAKIIQTAISDVGCIAKLDEPVRKLVIGSYVKSLEYSHAFSLACAIAGFVLALTIREHKLR